MHISSEDLEKMVQLEEKDEKEKTLDFVLVSLQASQHGEPILNIMVNGGDPRLGFCLAWFADEIDDGVAEFLDIGYNLS